MALRLDLGLLAACTAAFVACVPPLRIADGGDAAVDVREIAADIAVDVAPDLVLDVVDVPVDTGPPPPPVCPWPIERALTIPDEVHGTLPTTGMNPTAQCLEIFDGQAAYGERIYTLTVASPQGVEIRIAADIEAGNADFLPVVALRRACDLVSQELACAFHFFNSPGSFRAVLEPGTYFVVVDARKTTGPSATANPPFVLTVSSYTPGADASCENATRLAIGTPLTGRTTVDGARRGPTCGFFPVGNESFYALTVPAHTRVNLAAATTIASGSQQLTVQVIDSCFAARCFSSVTGAAGTPVLVPIDNDTDAPRDVIIVVAGSDSAMSVTFDLSATTGTIPYSVTTTSPVCDDLSSTSAVLLAPSGSMPDAWFDDSASAIMFMPIAFRLFDETPHYYSVTSNGYMQLWPTSAGSPSSTFVNVSLPSGMQPSRIIAPFWDDLAPVYTTGSPRLALMRIRSLLIGSAPMRRFVVEWDQVTNLNDPTMRMRFQAKLFETTNVVEFHYCQLTRDASAPVGSGNPELLYGSSATIGIQNAAGTDGVMYAFNRRMAISATTAIRFTPIP